MPSHVSSGSGSGGGSYTLPAATSSTLGGVKVGSGLAIDGSSVLSVAPSAALVKLAEVIVPGGGAASIAFSSIDQTYRSLQIVMQARSDAAANTCTCTLLFNGDSAAHYDNLVIYGYSGATGATDSYAQSAAVVAEITAATAAASVASLVLLCVPNYAGTTFHKTLLASSEYMASATTQGWVWEQRAVRWRSAAAISSLVLAPGSGNFAAGTTASLYGLA